VPPATASLSAPDLEAEATRIVPSVSSLPPSIRLEQGFLQGSQIGVFYDPMIAKLVVHGRDRTEALRVLRGALEEYHVVGLSTNIEFLRSLAGNEAFVEGDVETGFIKVIPTSYLNFQRSSHMFVRNTRKSSCPQFRSPPPNFLPRQRFSSPCATYLRILRPVLLRPG
jgi:acetyl/propionyl-CoA carboxylase alpha subunit